MISIPTSVGIHDINRTGYYRLSEIYRGDQKHADALRVGESMRKLLSFPTTFDGSLPGTSLSGENPPVRIGEKYNFEGAGPDGSNLIGEVADAIVDKTTKEAIIAIYTPENRAHILKEPMTEGQLTDYMAHKGAYFDEIKYVPRGIKTPYQMFLFSVQSQKGMKRDRLLNNLRMTDEEAKEMLDEDLLLEYCERCVSDSGLFEIANGVLTNKPKGNG